MTAQIPEKLFYNGHEYSMAAEPLNVYIKEHDVMTFPCSTGCYGGYYGTWRIEDDKLYLIDLYEVVFIKKSRMMDRVFPCQEKVFAEWFSGKIRVPHGELLKYVHNGYGSVYEKDMFLIFEKGVLIDTFEISNDEQYLILSVFLV